jgi:hypothetical protein
MTVTNPTTSAQTLRQLAENRLETAISQAADLREEILGIEGQLEDLEYPIHPDHPLEGLTISAEVEQITPEIEQIAGAAEELLRMARLLEFEAAAAQQLASCTDPRECLELNRYVEDYESEINRSVLSPRSNTGKLEAVRKPFNVLSPALWRHAKECQR